MRKLKNLQQYDELYDTLLPLKVLIPDVSNWKIPDSDTYEKATTHIFNGIAYIINTNEKNNRIECWCEHCRLTLTKRIMPKDLDSYIKALVKKTYTVETFDNLYHLREFCEDRVMDIALGNTAPSN